MKIVEKSRNQARIDHYGLPLPHDLKDEFGFGQISPIFPPIKNGGKINFFAFAASVLNRSNPSTIESISRQLGQVTTDDPRIRVVEAPFLGCGDGGLMPSIAMFTLAKGFLETQHNDATLQLCSDSAVSAQLARDAIDELFRLRAAGPEEHASLQGDFQYDVALSFAGEQRSFVQSLAYMLKAHGVRVFYDNDEQSNLWGKTCTITSSKFMRSVPVFVLFLFRRSTLRRNGPISRDKQRKIEHFEKKGMSTFCR
jgi:hypothetical protein